MSANKTAQVHLSRLFVWAKRDEIVLENAKLYMIEKVLFKG